MANTQEPTTYTPLQKKLAEAYRVHSLNANHTATLYAVVSQLFLHRLLRRAAAQPHLWQCLCTQMDALKRGEPLGSATLQLADRVVGVHDILSLVARVDFTITPSVELYRKFTDAIVRGLLTDYQEDDLERGATALAVYGQVTASVTDLLLEVLLTQLPDDETHELITEAFVTAMSAAVCSFIPASIPAPLKPEDIGLLMTEACIEWLQAHARPGQRLEHPFPGVTMYNGMMLRSLLRDIAYAEEYMLLSYHVMGNPEYKNLTTVDRDYIFYHSVLGKLAAQGVA